MAPVLASGAEPDSAAQSTANASRIEARLDPGAIIPAALTSTTDATIAPENPPSQEESSEKLELPKALLIPVIGLQYSQLRDTFSEGRSSGRIHDAIDIAAPEGTPIVAAADGTIAHLGRGARGGISIFQFDENQHFVYFYAHLHHYVASLYEGKRIKRGEIIGYVGHSGNARARYPHLHFAIARVGADKRWWGGDVTNPYPLLQNVNSTQPRAVAITHDGNDLQAAE